MFSTALGTEYSIVLCQSHFRSTSLLIHMHPHCQKGMRETCFSLTLKELSNYCKSKYLEYEYFATKFIDFSEYIEIKI